MGSLRLGNSLARFFCHPIAQAQKKTPPGPSYSSSPALRAAPREGAPELAAVAGPPRPRSPALPAPPPRGSGAARPSRRAPGEAARTTPHGPAPQQSRLPLRAGDWARPGELPPHRRGPGGPVRPLPAPVLPAGIRRAALVKERGVPASPGLRPPGSFARARGGAGPCRGESGPAARGLSSSAGETCPGPEPVSDARRSRCAKVSGTFCAPSPGGGEVPPGPSAGPAGRRWPRAARAGLPPWEPAPVSPGDAKTWRGGGQESGVPPPVPVLIARGTVPATPPVGARAARGCP